MAERRMLARSVVETDKFYSMTPTAQAFYMHFNMVADNDGYVTNPQCVISQYKHRKNALSELVSNGYIIIEETGKVLITHWFVANEKLRSSKNKQSSSRVRTCSKQVEEHSGQVENQLSTDYDSLSASYSSVSAELEQVKEINLPDIATKPDFDVEKVPGVEGSKVKYNISLGECEAANALTPEQKQSLVSEYGFKNVEKYEKLVKAYYRNKGSPPKDFATTVEMWMIRDNVKNNGDSDSGTLDLNEYKQFVNNFD